MQQNKKWTADLYLRLSREDGDKESAGKSDSNSIVNQRELALSFLRDRPEITLHEIRVDDGYTGSNFDRPAMQRLLAAREGGRSQLYCGQGSVAVWAELY